MTVTKLLLRLGTLFLVLMLTLGLTATPTLATEVEEVEDVRIEGNLDKIMPVPDKPGFWKLVVYGKTVILTPDTEVEKLPLKGTWVDITATPHYDVWLATELKGETDTVEGAITKIGYRMDGTIKFIIVNYVYFFVGEETEIDGDLMVGTMVRVTGVFDYGRFLAERIEVRED